MQRQVEASPAQIENCHEPGWRQQFGYPRGLLGRLAGHLMAVKNAEMHQLTVDQLELGEDDCVLEIGFGHGRMIRMMAECAPQGLVAGVDPSDVMLAQARWRNRAMIGKGPVELTLGTASSLPWPDRSFDKVCAVNSYQHWDDPVHDLLEVRRVLRDGAVLLLALRMHDPDGGSFSSPGFREAQVDGVVAQARAAGFRESKCEVHELSRTVALVRAIR